MDRLIPLGVFAPAGLAYRAFHIYWEAYRVDSDMYDHVCFFLEPSWHLPGTFLAPSRNLPDTFPEPS